MSGGSLKQWPSSSIDREEEAIQQIPNTRKRKISREEPTYTPQEWLKVLPLKKRPVPLAVFNPIQKCPNPIVSTSNPSPIIPLQDDPSPICVIQLFGVSIHHIDPIQHLSMNESVTCLERSPELIAEVRKLKKEVLEEDMEDVERVEEENANNEVTEESEIVTVVGDRRSTNPRFGQSVKVEPSDNIKENLILRRSIRTRVESSRLKDYDLK